MMDVKKLFIDAGVGTPKSEAWGREKDFTIIGFEPGADRYNSLKDVYPGKLLNVAVSDKDGEIDCWESPKWGMMLFDHNIFLPVKENFKRVKKKTIKIDNLDWRGFDEIHIWADIEGSELLMLKGATEMLSSGKVKWINLEIRVYALTKDWPTAVQIYGFLDKYGFKSNILLEQLPNHKRKHKDVIFVPK